jgi:hypothetical protein
VTSHEIDATAKISTMVSQMLTDVGIPATISALWVYHLDGTDTVESRWVGGKWVSVTNKVEFKRD